MPAMPPVNPLITPLPSSPVESPIVPVTPMTTDGTYDTVEVDTSYQPEASLLTYVEGSNYTVDYYSQLIGHTQELSPLNVDRPGSIQQYRRIHNYLLKVTRAWTPSQDEVSKSMVATGEATTSPGVIANVGDAFVADIGDGRLGIFTVATSEKKSLLRDSLYDITYTLTNYATDELLGQLNAKVVQDTTYVLSNLGIGQQPIVATQDAVTLQQLSDQRSLLIAQYFARFFSVEYQTLLVPGQTGATYDPWATKAILDFVPTNAAPLVPKVRLLNVQGDEAFNVKSLWDVLRTMRYDYMPLINQQFGITTLTGVTNRWPYFGSAFYTNLSYLVYPLDHRTDIDRQYVGDWSPSVMPFTEGNKPFDDLSRLITSGNLDGFPYPQGQTPALPDILPVTVDRYYVFSQGFYSQPAAPGSKLEQIVLQALQGMSYDNGVLLQLAKNSVKWNDLERYYYVPVLIALINCQLGVN